MKSIAETFRSAKVLVIGDVMLDEYIVGAVSRICPEAPVPVLDVRSRYSSAGGAANVAVNVAALGAAVDLVGLAGNDAAGTSLRRVLEQKAISCRGLVDAQDRGTISKTRIVAGQQQICRIDHETKSALPGNLADALMNVFVELLSDCSVVILSDYAKGVLSETVCRAVITSARAASKIIIVDPKSNVFQKYLGCTIVTPNVSEASRATGIEINSDASLAEAGTALQSQLPGTHILITRGPDGMALFAHQSDPMFISTVARSVFDVVGAGDTVVAALAVAMSGGFPLREAIEYANLAAGIVVEKPGTASVSVEELLNHQQRVRPGSSYSK